MIEPDCIPFFAALSEAGRERVRERSERLLVRTGETVLRRGERGRFLFSVASGGVTVETGKDGSGSVFLGPGEVFGEMSIVSGLPASAPVRKGAPPYSGSE